jgi:hypothetical protein
VILDPPGSQLKKTKRPATPMNAAAACCVVWCVAVWRNEKNKKEKRTTNLGWMRCENLKDRSSLIDAPSTKDKTSHHREDTT